MTATKTEPTLPRRRRWLRWALGGTAVLIVLAYFVVTSGAFFKRLVLPRVGRSIHADIAVADAEIHPFSRVVLRGLELKPTGAETLLTAAEVRVRYRLWAVLSGTIALDEVTLVSPMVNLVQNADGTSNLDPLLKTTPAEKPAVPAPAPAKPSKPLALDIRSVTITNATIRQVNREKDGAIQTLELSRVNASVTNLKNGQTARVDLAADILFGSQPPAPATNATMQARVTGNLAVDLTPDLQPQALRSDVRVSVDRATGAFSDLATLAAHLDCDVTPVEVKQVALEFRKGTADLGQLHVSGPFDLRKREGRLAVEIRNIDRNVLNLAGGARGLDFGSSVINSTNQIAIADGGHTISVAGQLAGSSLTISQKGLSTPALDLAVGYNVTVDQPRQTATIQTLTIDARRHQRPLLQGALTKPMKLVWAHDAETHEESAFDLTLSDLNLADWQAFLGTNVSGGLISAKLDVNSQQSGRQLSFTGRAEGRDVTAAFGSRRFEQAGISLQCRGSLAEFHQLELSQLDAKLTQRKEPVVSAGGSGTVDLKTRDGTLTVKLDAVLPALAALAGVSGVDVSRGLLSAKLDVVSGKSGQELGFTGTVAGSDLSAVFSSNRIDQAGFSLRARGNLAGYHTLELTNVEWHVTHRGQTIVSAGGSGSVDLPTMDGRWAVKLEAALPGLAALAGVAGLEATSGSLRFEGQIQQAHVTPAARSGNTEQTIQGDLALTDFAGRYREYQFDRLDAAVACDVGMIGQQANVRKLNATLRQAGQAAGRLEMKGGYNLATKAASAAVTLTDLNQNVLRSCLQPSLGNRTLTSVSINGSMNGSYNPAGDTEIKGDWEVARLVVNDPSGAIPGEPLEAKLKIDAALHRSVAEIRDSLLTLTPTARAKNEIRVQGRVDFTQTKAIAGQVKISAESLDVTRYYDLFAGKPRSGATPAAARSTGPAASAPSGPDQEPAAIELPFRNFTVDAAIGHLWLREVEITGLQSSVKLDGGAVLVKPFQLALNGGPVNGSVALNLGVPGYQYDIDLKAKRVPLTPLVSSFQPERRGQIGGTASVSAQLKGAGATGASLHRNLAGQFDISSTNLNLSVGNVRSPLMKSLINTVAGIPDLIRNPGAGVANLLGRLTGTGGQTSGFTDELTKAPIDVIAARGQIGNGRLDLQRAVVQSQAFQAEANGAIHLAPVLANSTLEVPVMVSLRQPLAEKVGLVPAGTPANAAYVKLPDFLKIKGTLGEPKEDINYLALTTMAAKAGTGILGKTGAGAAGVLDAVGNLLRGGPAPGGGTNAPPVINPLDLFRRR